MYSFCDFVSVWFCDKVMSFNFLIKNRAQSILYVVNHKNKNNSTYLFNLCGYLSQIYDTIGTIQLLYSSYFEEVLLS